MSDLQSLDITIESITEKDNRVSLKSTEGKSYSFFKTKQDGKESVAYAQMKAMGLSSGATVNIGYDESKGTREGKEITYRNIRTFRETNQPMHTTPSAPKQQTNSDGQKQGMAIKSAIDAWVAGKVSDWRVFAREIYLFDCTTPSAPEEPSINVEDVPF